MNRLQRTSLIALFALGVALQLSAKDVEVTISRTDSPPAIDGVLDDSIWLNVDPITGFMQYYPAEGIAPSESTELYIAYDEKNFYLAFKCYDSNMNEVRATMTQRDKWDNDCCVGFSFDPYNAEQEGFLFNINPYGILCDFIWHHDGYVDNGWDADARAEAKLYPDCYCIEAAVPFKSLRMPAKREQEWGFYALRSIKHKGEMVVWPPRTHKIPNLLAQASLLRGIRDVETGRSLALLPYVFSSHIQNPYEKGRPIDAGIDFRCGITSDLMLDLTVNPDFSQIEADPDRIELTERYAQMLPEKRPFFTEGTDVFASNQALFYSRAIANPMAGLKLTGKIGRNRVAFLSAADEELNSGGMEYYNHLRAKCKLLKESSIGLLMTNKDDFGNETYNRTLSMDGVLRLRHIYSLKAQVTRSMTKDAVASYGATGYNLNLERLGANVYNSVWFNDFPPEFEAQSGSMWDVLGFRTLGTHHDLSLRKPFERLNEIAFHGGAKGRFNYDDELQEEYFWAAAEASLDKVWTKLNFFKNHELYNSQDFRYSGFEYETWNTPAPYLENYVSLIWGGAPHYNEGFTGWKYRLTYSAVIKPIKRIVYNASISREDFYREFGGARSYLQTIVWNKLSYQIIRAMFLRGIYQYNTLGKTSDASVLFASEYSPLSNIYIGANFNDFSAIEQMGDSLEVFAKISYLWRL